MQKKTRRRRKHWRNRAGITNSKTKKYNYLMNITKVIKYFITEINYERELSTLNEKEKNLSRNKKNIAREGQYTANISWTRQETRTAKIKKKIIMYWNP